MEIVRKIAKYFLFILLIPIAYVVISLTLSTITIDRNKTVETPDKTIYLASNGVHLDMVIPIRNLDSLLLLDLHYMPNEKYMAFGWGDAEFYLNTPTWDDLTFSTAFKALFLSSSALIHVTRYEKIQNHWIKIKITESELRELNTYLQNNFILDKNGEKILLKNQGYTKRDNFYKAKGSFSFYKTCNSWVNTGFKSSGLKSCLWTPFDFGLMSKYE